MQEDPREVSCVSCFRELLSCLVVLPMETPRPWRFTDPVPEGDTALKAVGRSCPVPELALVAHADQLLCSAVPSHPHTQRERRRERGTWLNSGCSDESDTWPKPSVLPPSPKVNVSVFLS